MTFFISGTAFLTACSTPWLMVILDIGHPPQAPIRRTLTTPSSTFINSISPPSACKAGRILSKAFSTFSFIVLTLLSTFQYVNVHDDASFDEISLYLHQTKATSSVSSESLRETLSETPLYPPKHCQSLNQKPP